MLEWKTLDFKQKTIFACGVILIIFPFIPWWIHPIYNAFWIPLIGMYIGSPINNFIIVNIIYYIFAAITLLGGVMCCFEQRNHRVALFGAIIAMVGAFTFMAIFIAGTSDLNIPYFILDGLIADAYGKGNVMLTSNFVLTKILIEVGMYLDMLGGHIVSLNYATQYYIGSLPILIGALAAVVAW